MQQRIHHVSGVRVAENLLCLAKQGIYDDETECNFVQFIKLIEPEGFEKHIVHEFTTYHMIYMQGRYNVRF